MSKLVAGHNYDVLDYHAAKFKQPDEEHQPRIVDKKNSKSKLLASSNFYQPPMRRKKQRPKEEAAPTQAAKENENPESARNDQEEEQIVEDLENSFHESVRNEPAPRQNKILNILFFIFF